MSAIATGSLRETGAESQISVVRYGWQNPWWAMRRNERYELEPVFKEQMTARSQDLPELFCPTGAIWWARTGTLRRTKTFHLENRTGWEIPWQRGIDIDTFEDWAMAEVLFKLPDPKRKVAAATPSMAYLNPDARKADRRLAEWVNSDCLKRGPNLPQPWTVYVDDFQYWQIFL